MARLGRLCLAIPPLTEIRDKLSRPLLFQHWDDSAQSAIWIASDGDDVRCVTVSGLSVAEMGAIWISFNERLSRANFDISAQLVRDIIEAEIDVVVALVN